MVVKFVKRANADRGLLAMAWFKGLSTFTFAPHYDAGTHTSFGPLNAMIEIVQEPGKVFASHGHEEVEVFSYIVSGELAHHDSMDNISILKRGSVQVNTSGTGMTHSEKCHASENVNFLQFWAKPNKPGVTPKYYIRHFTDDEKKDQWLRVIAPIDAHDQGVKDVREGSGPAPVQADLTLYATLLSPTKSISYEIPAARSADTPREQRMIYVHVVQGSGFNTGDARGATVKLSGGGGEVLELKEGDAAYVHGAVGDSLLLENQDGVVAEILIFDLELPVKA